MLVTVLALAQSCLYDLPIMSKTIHMHHSWNVRVELVQYVTCMSVDTFVYLGVCLEGMEALKIQKKQAR